MKKKAEEIQAGKDHVASLRAQLGQNPDNTKNMKNVGLKKLAAANENLKYVGPQKYTMNIH